jgi:hypothetical protein
MLADVGHEVLRPLQPANARSRARPSEVSRPSGPSTGPLARQQADPTKAATGCDLRVMSKQGHSPCVAYASYSSHFSCADCLDRLPESRTSRPLSRCLDQKIWSDSSGSTVDANCRTSPILRLSMRRLARRQAPRGWRRRPSGSCSPRCGRRGRQSPGIRVSGPDKSA